MEVTERELLGGDFQLIGRNVGDENGSSNQNGLVLRSGGVELSELAPHPQSALPVQDDHSDSTTGHELERRSSQWVFPLFGRRREGSDEH